MERYKIIFVSFVFLFAFSELYAEDPLDHLTGTEEWDREEEAKRQIFFEMQKKRLLSEEYIKAQQRFSSMQSQWQQDLSKFQDTRRTVEDILFQEESKNYQQVNVREKLPANEVKHIKASQPSVNIESGDPIIEKDRLHPGSAPPSIQSPSVRPVQVQQPKRDEPQEPTTEEILKRQEGYFDERGQFVDEDLKKESSRDLDKDQEIDYDSP